MAENTKIEWATHTFNPWTGCTAVSAGCDHCYAEGWAKRSGLVKWGNHPRRRTSKSVWAQPLKWAKKAAEYTAKHGRRPRVFCASLADVFDNQVPEVWRADLFELIFRCPELDWLLLTKRPQNIAKMLPYAWGNGAGWGHVWLGTTAENQAAYDRRWPILSAIPAAVRFISYEPAIGPLRLHETGPQPDWLICGGESGSGARTMAPAWPRDVIADCRRLGVAPFFKQWGSLGNNPTGRDDGHGKGGGLIDGTLVRDYPRSPAP